MNRIKEWLGTPSTQFEGGVTNGIACLLYFAFTVAVLGMVALKSMGGAI